MKIWIFQGVKMKLSTKSKEYIIPEYSLTGDLLSFLTCNLQYRYQNKGNLPPSMPIQLWFGEFIHGALEEAFLKWKKSGEDKKSDFPWDWEDEIKPIEDLITGRLKIKGLNPPLDYINNYGPKDNIYSARLEKSINLWGPHLFPLIDDTEVLLKGLRELECENSRSDYYSINGVVDVLSSKKMDYISQQTNNKSFQQTLDSYFEKPENKILEYLSNNSQFKELLEKGLNEYEIIIDYKGMRRPSAPSKEEYLNIQSKMTNGDLDESEEYSEFKAWIQHEWQILTYAWLRKNQSDSQKPVVGIIFYLNELVPSTDDLVAIIRIINIDEDLMGNSLNEFDQVVKDIESSIVKEMNGLTIKEAWKADAEDRTCTACDFRTFCNKKKKEKNDNKQLFTIP